MQNKLMRQKKISLTAKFKIIKEICLKAIALESILLAV